MTADDDLAPSPEEAFAVAMLCGAATLRIKQTGTSTWWPLSTTPKIIDAYVALKTKNSLTVEFRRPKSTSPFYDIHIMNITLIP